MSWPPRNKAAENIRNPADVFPIAGEWAADSRPDPDPLAALSDPDSCPDPDPIRRPLRSRFGISMAIRLAVLCSADDAADWLPGSEASVVQGCLGGRIAAPGGGFAGLMFFAVPSARGEGTRHPHLGNCTVTFGSLLVTTENKAVAGGRELMGSRRAFYGALRVNALIHRGLRKKAELGALTPMHTASGVCPAHIRCLSGVTGYVQR